jgi:hypothetical protein
LNAFAERWVRSVKEECLSHLILFGERSLRKALTQFQEHYPEERNHQGKSNVLLFPVPAPLEPGGRRGIRCRERLGGFSDSTAAPHEYFDPPEAARTAAGSVDRIQRCGVVETPGNAFYDRLNQILDEHNFDQKVEAVCRIRIAHLLLPSLTGWAGHHRHGGICGILRE